MGHNLGVPACIAGSPRKWESSRNLTHTLKRRYSRKVGSSTIEVFLFLWEKQPSKQGGKTFGVLSHGWGGEHLKSGVQTSNFFSLHSSTPQHFIQVPRYSECKQEWESTWIPIDKLTVPQPVSSTSSRSSFFFEAFWAHLKKDKTVLEWIFHPFHENNVREYLYSCSKHTKSDVHGLSAKGSWYGEKLFLLAYFYYKGTMWIESLFTASSDIDTMVDCPPSLQPDSNESNSSSDVPLPPTYAALPKTTKLDEEPNPFEQSFNAAQRILSETKSTAKPTLPPVADLESPSRGILFKQEPDASWDSLRAGPLSPTMLLGPARAYQQPTRSSLSQETTFRPPVSGKMPL